MMSIVALLLGIMLITIGLMYAYFKVEIALDHCEGGAPLLDGYVFPPVVLGIGAHLLLRWFQITVSVWISTALAFVVLFTIYRFAWSRGRRPEKALPEAPVVPTMPGASWEVVGDHSRGALIAVRFAGTYASNKNFSSEMSEFLRFALAKANAAAVIIDLTALDFRSGDDLAGLGALVIPLEQTNGELRPAAVVASERSAPELRWLFEPSIILGVAGVKLLRNRDEALAYIRNALG